MRVGFFFSIHLGGFVGGRRNGWEIDSTHNPQVNGANVHTLSITSQRSSCGGQKDTEYFYVANRRLLLRISVIPLFVSPRAERLLDKNNSAITVFLLVGEQYVIVFLSCLNRTLDFLGIFCGGLLLQFCFRLASPKHGGRSRNRLLNQFYASWEVGRGRRRAIISEVGTQLRLISYTSLYISMDEGGIHKI